MTPKLQYVTRLAYFPWIAPFAHKFDQALNPHKLDLHEAHRLTCALGPHQSATELIPAKLQAYKRKKGRHEAALFECDTPSSEDLG
jgi:hypothetical protein